jgi:YaiO family outer membrane protein
MFKIISILSLALLPFSAFAENKFVDITYHQEQNSNNQPDWKSTDLSYTQKANDNYWQFSVRQHERYNLKDNEVFFNGTNNVLESDTSKTFMSYSLGAGDFNKNGYLPEYRAGFSLQQTYKDGSISPIFDYKYSKYQSSFVNYFALAGEKYIGNWRFLAGVWTSDSSFYKPTYGVRSQVSYYLNDTDSINYYFSTGEEPEIVGNFAKVYNITSHAITSKVLIDKNLYFNIGIDKTINQGNYSRTGLTIGLSYAF